MAVRERRSLVRVLVCAGKVSTRERWSLVRVLVRAYKVLTHERYSPARVLCMFGCMRGVQPNEPQGADARWWPTSGCHHGTTFLLYACFNFTNSFVYHD